MDGLPAWLGPVLGLGNDVHNGARAGRRRRAALPFSTAARTTHARGAFTSFGTRRPNQEFLLASSRADAVIELKVLRVWPTPAPQQ